MKGLHHPYGSLNGRREDRKQEYEYSPLLNDEKYGYVITNHDNRKHRTLMMAWAIVVMVASYFVLSRSSTPLTVFKTSNIDNNNNNNNNNILPIESPEEWIKELPSSESIKNFLHVYASEPHLAGSQKDRHLAEWTRDMFIEFGIVDSTIETYYPVLNYPKSRQLSLLNGTEALYEAGLKEDDKDTTPTFHGYSGDGNVTAPVIYVNYGTLEDFQLLVDKDIKVKGNIALIRSGEISRGQKIRAAEAYGCVGVLIYSDPSDLPSETFGLWQSTTVERGTAHYYITPGDPTSPGYASTSENITRIALEDSETVPQIPSLPISWKDAIPFLNATHELGIQIPEWKGDLLNIGYYTGPSQLEVNLININDNQIRPIWNVIGRIDGAEEPDRVIILGNHRDSWSYGAIHPSSGSASLLELVRVFGKLLESGWRPRRTIIFASWDAKEYGAVGSTEWVEEHQEWLGTSAVAYLNVDTAVSGTEFNAEASPLLYRLLYEVTGSIIDPKTSLTVLEAWSTRHLQNYFEDLTLPDDHTVLKKHKHKHKHHKHNRDDIDLTLIKPLGGASDHVPFFHHAGISSLSFGFHGDYDVFHSSVDSIELIEDYVDPTYEYHQSLVKIWGLLAYRLSSDIIIPIYPLDYIQQLSVYVDHLESIYHNSTTPEPTDPSDGDDGDNNCKSLFVEMKKKHKNKKKHHEDDDNEGDDDEEKDLFLPKMATSLKRLEEEGAHLEHKTSKVYKKLAQDKVSNKVWRHVDKINDRIALFERAFINLAELEDQQWYRHIVYTPADWADSEGQILPSLHQALESKNKDNILYAEEKLVASLEIAQLILKGDYEDVADLS
ncbi:unnamed protein product [Cunninghamella echinulata]